MKKTNKHKIDPTINQDFDRNPLPKQKKQNVTHIFPYKRIPVDYKLLQSGK
jgi:hypothetical protein